MTRYARGWAFHDILEKPHKSYMVNLDYLIGTMVFTPTCVDAFVSYQYKLVYP